MRADVAALLEASPPGSALWLRGLGRSMAPLLRSGDSLRVLRCSASEVRPGDIALLRRPDGGLTAHLVDAISPLATSSFLGRRDAPGGEVLGRVVAVRTRGLVVPLPRGGRHLLSALHRAASAASRAPGARGVARALRGLATSRWTAPLRRGWLGALSVRQLGPEDLEPLLLLAADAVRLPADVLARQLAGPWQARGLATGAFGARGRMVGFASLDEDAREGVAPTGGWIRGLVVAPRARGLGVAERLVEHLCARGRALGLPSVRVEVRADDAPSLQLFSGLGFVRAGDVSGAEVRAAPEEARPGVGWLVLERRIDARP